MIPMRGLRIRAALFVLGYLAGAGILAAMLAVTSTLSTVAMTVLLTEIHMLLVKLLVLKIAL